MEKIGMINLNDFMSLYAAVSFLQEQRFFNINNIKNYLMTFHGASDDTISEIDSVIMNMEEAKMIESVPNFTNLYKISKKIPFKEIIFSNYDYLPVMMNFFYNVNNSSISNVKLMTSEDDYISEIKK